MSFLRLPRRFQLRCQASRVHVEFCDDEQDLPLQEQDRRQRVLAKLITMLGLECHPQRIMLAVSFRRVALSKPRWVDSWMEDDTDCKIVLNQPLDLVYDLDKLQGEYAEFGVSNTALFYVWLDTQFPQETID